MFPIEDQRPIGAGELGRRLIFHGLGVSWAREGYTPRAIVIGPTEDIKMTVAGEAVSNQPTCFAIRTINNPFPVAGTYRIWLEMRNSQKQLMLGSTRPIRLPVEATAP